MSEPGPTAGQLIQDAHHHLPAGSLGNIYADLIIREGRGSRVWDVGGKEYIDLLMGSGPMLLGHAHPQVVAAVQAQVQRGTTFFATCEHAVALAGQIIDAVRCAEQVRFTSTGTEATHYAMRIARAFRRRAKVLKFEGAYHGMNDYALMSMGPADPPAFPQAVPDSAGIPPAITDQVLIAPFNDIQTTSALIEKHHEELACVIVEPVQRMVVPKPGFLASLRELTLRYDLVLIFDEVVTGFRLAYGGAQAYYGVVPDLCTLGKVVGGGFPLAAVAGRKQLMQVLDPQAAKTGQFVPQIGTLNGNPIAAIAGLTTLEILKREQPYERLFAMGRQVQRGLKQQLDDAGIPAQVSGEPPVFGVAFTARPISDYRSGLQADTQRLKRFNELLRQEGILKGDSKFYMSTAHTQADVDKTLQAFATVARQLVSETG